ncbi:unnamed protein product [Cunninghamella blakesleeana]
MSGLHLSHKIAWMDAVKLFTFTKDPGVEFPICESQKIHIINKETKIKFENRKHYLLNQVCDIDSHEIIGKKRFYKNTKETIDLEKHVKTNSYDDEESLGSIKLVKQLTESIIEFAETESIIYNGNNNKINQLNEKEQFHSIIKQLEKENDWFKPKNESLFDTCLCWLFHVLIETGDVATLLSFTDNQIKSVFSCSHGGQAVGNNTNFLIHHIIKVYVFTNLIYTAGFVNHCEKWGPMAPKNYFRSMIMTNCDGQTFLYQSRQHLTDEVYMKDLTATKQLCKDCFRFIYTLCMIRMKIYGKEETEDWIKNQIYIAL